MRYSQDRKGVAALLVGRDMRQAMRLVGLSALGHAVAIAPKETGDYAKSFVVDVDILDGRATAVLANTDKGGAAIEWGATGSHGHFTLTRTADWVENG